MLEINSTDLAALAEELKNKREDGCTICAHAGKPNRNGVYFCDVHGVYNPKFRCAFFSKKGKGDDNA